MALGELPIHICEERVALANKADAQTMIDTILEVGDQYRLPVGLIVIDTSAKLIANGGGDENLARDVANVWSWLTLVRSETGVHSMIVGHKGKNGSKGERGSSATLGDADMVLTVDGEAAKTLSITEANDADCGPVFSFEMDKYVFGTDEDGDEDCVHIVGKEVAAPETRESGGLLKNDKTMLQILWDSQGMTKELWNAAARDAGIGNSRRAELHDIRVRLKDLKLVREYNGIWRAVKS